MVITGCYDKAFLHSDIEIVADPKAGKLMLQDWLKCVLGLNAIICFKGNVRIDMVGEVMQHTKHHWVGERARRRGPGVLMMV